MNDETFRHYLSAYPEVYARGGWDLGRILADLRRQHGDFPGLADMANEAAALLEGEGWQMTSPVDQVPGVLALVRAAIKRGGLPAGWRLTVRQDACGGWAIDLADENGIVVAQVAPPRAGETEQDL
jgi:hypothetical protein